MSRLKNLGPVRKTKDKTVTKADEDKKGDQKIFQFPPSGPKAQRERYFFPAPIFCRQVPKHRER